MAEPAVVALRSVLQAQLRGRLTDDQLRYAMRVLADEARRRDVRAEQLLVVVKNAWASLPEVHKLPAGEQRSAVLGRIVTMSINEYYGEHR